MAKKQGRVSHKAEQDTHTISYHTKTWSEKQSRPEQIKTHRNQYLAREQAAVKGHGQTN